MTTIREKKHPDESFPKGFQYIAPDLLAGETLSSCAVVAEVGLTVTTPGTISGDECVTQVSGGTSGEEYTITFTMTTSAGNTYVDKIVMKVQS